MSARSIHDVTDLWLEVFTLRGWDYGRMLRRP
jgi:hypothetical protein